MNITRLFLSFYFLIVEVYFITFAYCYPENFFYQISYFNIYQLFFFQTQNCSLSWEYETHLNLKNKIKKKNSSSVAEKNKFDRPLHPEIKIISSIKGLNKAQKLHWVGIITLFSPYFIFCLPINFCFFFYQPTNCSYFP